MLDLCWIFLRFKRPVNLLQEPKALSCLSVSSYMFPLVMAWTAWDTHIFCCIRTLSPLDVFPLYLVWLGWPLYLVASLIQIIGTSVNINWVQTFLGTWCSFLVVKRLEARCTRHLSYTGSQGRGTVVSPGYHKKTLSPQKQTKMKRLYYLISEIRSILMVWLQSHSTFESWLCCGQVP